ncbi:hypothetical protein KP509_34G039100 [Ceratopteris richardii]|uniref:Ubiquitin thioesterase OTU n=1 Tax=Ceratopteris richardii TaxID=49495 RepID=A0A8T2QIX2_CERRI|nr:hypothetical protein KP509_34G039100 [Ceratopteris richardii]KAH7284093.1 hypothetical protein KP509_34G039100 [Ceratopteris richardii]
MSIAHIFAGQSLRSGLFLSSFRLSKFSRPWLKPGSDCLSLKSEATGLLRNQPWQMPFHGNSLWLLLGLCTFSITTSVGPLGGLPALAEPLRERSDADNVGVRGTQPVIASATPHGKKILTDYSVIGIPGDGSCLFRALVHGSHVQKGMGTPSESVQREIADVLRGKVVDELVKRREETEWFIEGDFDAYIKRMRQPHIWGGEPELLMASHVLRMPITVYMFESRARGLIPIAEYGQQYIKESPAPIRVLYHGFGHYDALELLTDEL